MGSSNAKIEYNLFYYKLDGKYLRAGLPILKWWDDVAKLILNTTITFG